jgi:hypothetical protein
MMADYFINDEAQEFLGEIGIEFRVLGQFAQAIDLAVFAARIGGGQAMLGLVSTDCLRHFEPLGQHEDQGRINIVDAVAKLLQLRIGHVGLPHLHLP